MICEGLNRMCVNWVNVQQGMAYILHYTQTWNEAEFMAYNFVEVFWAKS